MLIIERLKEKLELLKTQHQEIYNLILDCREEAAKTSNEDIVDQAFILKSMSTYCDDLRKEITGIREVIEKIACYRWTLASVNDGGAAKCIQGKLATATPNVRQIATLPNKNKEPEKYVKFMKQIGVNGPALRSGLVTIHWPSIVEHLTELAKDGKPLPDGIDINKTYPKYSLILREKKGQ